MTMREVPLGMRYLTAAEVAQMIGVSRSALYNWRAAGLNGGVNPGPPSFKIGAKIAYELVAVEQWLEQQKAATGSGTSGQPPEVP